jgi:hypothetical protein
LLDERFGIGCFEDDDYTRRALQAGYRAVIARDAFIHHFGSRTFAGAHLNQGDLLERNRELYRQKWEKETVRPEPAPSKVPVMPLTPATTTPNPRVLLIGHVGRLRDRMDKSHYRRYEALARQPGVTLFGPGIEGYRAGMIVDEAVAVACHGQWPDVILHGGDLNDSGVPLLIGLEQTPALTAIELLDSWARPERSADFIRRHRFQIGLIQEAGPHLAQYQQLCPETQFFWTPNAVDVRLFRNYELPKEYDVILYGEINPKVYPLRARLARLLAGEIGLRIRLIAHPGYYPEAGDAEGVIAGEALSREINKAWIGIATRSVYNCFLMKYFEIAASFALVAGNMPDHAREVFGSDFLELGMQQSDEEIIAAFKGALADKDRLKACIGAAHRRVVTEFSTERHADRVLAILQECLAKRRAPVTPVNLEIPAPPSHTESKDPPPPAPESAPPPSGSRGRLIVRRSPKGGLLLEREDRWFRCA